MEAFYYLMRKNKTITLVEINDRGQMLSYQKDVLHKELAPLQSRVSDTWLRDWWEDRAIPLTRDGIKEFLDRQGCSIPVEYLAKNLGLSMTDYYWIRPVDSDLTWEQVNLFDNDFKQNVSFFKKKNRGKSEIPQYSPDASLQGDIEKTWTIIEGDRCLVKGNRNYLSAESINEVIASHIHAMQGYTNYAEYHLIRIKDRPYTYGCYTKAFTSQEKELIPAYALWSSEKKKNNVSPFQHFITVCKHQGMDTVQLQQDLDYLILTDFIISEYDRHLNNFGVIRNAETLALERLAPIYDSGGCLFVNREIPNSAKQLLNIPYNGLVEKEVNMLRYVKDREAIDLTKLPPASYIEKIYAKDEKMSERDVKKITLWYEKKIELCRDFQLGKDLWKAT